MKFFVNFLSAFRICVAFIIIPTLMFKFYWLSFVLFVLGAISDWFDGYLARKYNVCTKIGGVMDHIGDKLLVVNTLVMLSIMTPIWFIIVPVIIMISRELYISGLREFLGTQKIEMPVPKARFSMGKIKTALQMCAIICFLLMFALASFTNPELISDTKLRILLALPQLGITILWFALIASLWSATEYTKTFISKLKNIK